MVTSSTSRRFLALVAGTLSVCVQFIVQLSNAAVCKDLEFLSVNNGGTLCNLNDVDNNTPLFVGNKRIEGDCVGNVGTGICKVSVCDDELRDGSKVRVSTNEDDIWIFQLRIDGEFVNADKLCNEYVDNSIRAVCNCGTGNQVNFICTGDDSKCRDTDNKQLDFEVGKFFDKDNDDDDDDDDDDNNNNDNGGAIAGGVVSGVVVLGIVGFFVYKRRKEADEEKREAAGYPPTQGGGFMRSSSRKERDILEKLEGQDLGSPGGSVGGMGGSPKGLGYDDVLMPIGIAAGAGAVATVAASSHKHKKKKPKVSAEDFDNIAYKQAGEQTSGNYGGDSVHVSKNRTKLVDRHTMFLKGGKGSDSAMSQFLRQRMSTVSMASAGRRMRSMSSLSDIAALDVRNFKTRIAEQDKARFTRLKTTESFRLSTVRARDARQSVATFATGPLSPGARSNANMGDFEEVNLQNPALLNASVRLQAKPEALISAICVKLDKNTLTESEVKDVDDFSSVQPPDIPFPGYLFRLVECLEHWFSDESSTKNMTKLTFHSSMAGKRIAGVGVRSLLLSLVYLEKIKKMDKNFTLTVFNRHRLFAVMMLIAAKFTEDELIMNSYWAEATGMEVEDVNDTEEAFCRVAGFNFFVTDDEVESMYKKYGIKSLLQ